MPCIEFPQHTKGILLGVYALNHQTGILGGYTGDTIDMNRNTFSLLKKNQMDRGGFYAYPPRLWGHFANVSNKFNPDLWCPLGRDKCNHYTYQGFCCLKIIIILEPQVKKWEIVDDYIKLKGDNGWYDALAVTDRMFAYYSTMFGYKRITHEEVIVKIKESIH